MIYKVPLMSLDFTINGFQILYLEKNSLNQLTITFEIDSHQKLGRKESDGHVNVIYVKKR